MMSAIWQFIVKYEFWVLMTICFGLFHRRESHRGRHIREHRHLDFHSRHYSVGHASDVEEGKTGRGRSG